MPNKSSDTIYHCKLCNKQFNSLSGLSRHLSQVHKCDLESYYIEHIGEQGRCVVCGGQVRFKGFTQGYENCCSHKCGGIHHRKNLKMDVEKELAFRTKVSQSVKANWMNNDQSKRIEKMTNSRRATISRMTDEERIDAFGYLNTLTENERAAFISNLVQTGAHEWWKTATDEEKTLVINKRTATLRQTWDKYGGEILRKIDATFIKNHSTIMEDIQLSPTNLDKIFGNG